MQYRKIKIKEKTNKVESSTKDSLLDELLALKNLTTEEQIKKFLNPDEQDFISPYAFLDMEKAVKRIFEAIEKGQKILVWGDFDCDGVTSSAIMYKTLTALGADVMTFIPDRLLHGHGLNSKELLKFAAKERVKLVVTVDCGISNVSEVKLLKGLGIDTIITDHHSTDAEIPQGYAIINAQVKNSIKEDLKMDEISSMTCYSGSITAYKLSMALLENFENKNLKEELLIIASMGAIADIVPLLGEVRAMVSVSLKLLNEKKENSQKNIYKLLSKNVKDREITSYDVSFILAPRINAVGRLANAKLSFDFLTTQDDAKLDIIIEKLDNYNKIRQSKCSEVYDEIIEYLKNNPKEKNNPAIVLINPDWHIGIIGIVASKIVEEFNKPCFLMTVDGENNARCSIRSNESINVYQVLKENENLFKIFGGHQGAGGCLFESSEFENVKSAILKTVSELSTNSHQENVLYADVELKSDEIDLNILDSINKLEPFGEKNEPPLFALFNVNLDEFKLIGKEQNHLRVVFSDLKNGGKKFQCVKWSEKEINIPLNSNCDIAFYPRLNVFNDVPNLQLELVDVYSDAAVVRFGKNPLKIFDHRKKTGILAQIASYLERDGLDIAIWAKNPSTKETLSKYKQIKDNFVSEASVHKGLMFFDYPSSESEMVEIYSLIRPEKVHFMNCFLDENLENYVKQLNGMVKYCSNKLEGQIDILKLAQSLCVSENFVQIGLEIFENIGSVEILDVDKIKYLKPFSYVEFKNNSMFEVLKEEFESILDFKKHILNCDVKELEKMLIG